MSSSQVSLLFFVSCKTGRGVFAVEDIQNGQFIVQYHGELLSAKEGNSREREKPSSFRYFFKHDGKKYW